MHKSICFPLILSAAFLCGGAFAAPTSQTRARPTAVPDTTPPHAMGPVVANPNAFTLSESFNDITTLAGSGWVLQNHSGPVGSTNWFQGTNVAGGGPFDAYNGAANAYIGANYNNTGSTGTISNWLVTPVLDFGANAGLTFYTRKNSPDAYADRLEVRLSTSGASSNVGASATDVGDFTTLKLSVNPTLVLGVYPTVWTQYSVTGLPHNGQGRIAFRYYVTGGGSLGTASDYIGIDQVDYAAGTAEYQVGASVTGLAGSGLTLQLNGANDLPVSADGSFLFPPYISDGGNYAVTVSSQPTNLSQTCTVNSGSGTIAGANPNVQIVCTTNAYSIGGSVAGLAGSGLTLQLNGAHDLSIAADGSFAFPTSLADGNSYIVTVSAQPAALTQTCSVSNASGTLAGSNVGDVSVTCVTDNYTIGGSVSGLAGTGLVLQLNGTNNLPISADGSFVFPAALADGSSYIVTVSAQPAALTQTCSVSNGSGTLAGSNVGDVSVTCVTNNYTIGGSVSGLAGTGLVLQLNGTGNLPISANGSFVFPAALVDGSPYSVTVGTQPTGPRQTCLVSNGNGMLGGGNVSNVAVVCTTNTYAIGGAVSGLGAGTGLVLQLNGANDLPISADGTFAFSSLLNDGSPYNVTVSAQPSGASGVCIVVNGSGIVAGNDVANIEVPCDVIFIDGFDEP